MGERIDVVLLIGPAIFVLEFKVGEEEFTSYALDQVCDYALDLKNFHETSHDPLCRPCFDYNQSEALWSVRGSNRRKMTSCYFQSSVHQTR
jgi:hypothetical protein